MTHAGATIARRMPIDVVSDVVCPWCYLGKRRLDEALELTPELNVAVNWKPFRLDPTIPPEGISRQAYLERKFGSVEANQPMYDDLVGLGRMEDIDFRFDRITRSPNTVDAHRLIRWAAEEDAQAPVVERLFFAYFTEGLDIGDHGVLATVADDAGLEADIASRLASDEDRAAVEAEIENAYKIGVTGVPCYIIDSRYAVMGAQESGTLAQALAEIAASAQPN